MAYDYNAKEVFEIAIRIEENGAAFYRKAAQLQDNPEDKEFLETLARMEGRHKADFESMKAQVSDLEKKQTVFDPEEELVLYLAAMADSHGGEGHPDILDLFNGQETIAEVVTTAIDLEKQSILFYIGLSDLVPEKYGKNRILAIIEEEKKHVAQLSSFLKKTKESR